MPDLVGTVEPNMNEDGSVGAVDDSKLNLDPELVNSSVFPTQLTAVENPVNRFEDDGRSWKKGKKGRHAKKQRKQPTQSVSSLIVVAVGDANTAFFSKASGISPGKIYHFMHFRTNLP